MEKFIDNVITLLENFRAAWQEVTLAKWENGGGQRRPAKRKKIRQRNVAYIKWRLAGILLIAATIPVVKILEGDATIAIFTVPLGLYMLMGKPVERY